MTDPATQEELRQLRQQLQATEEWAEGVYVLLETVLAHLLRGHPRAPALGQQLQRMAAQHDRLEQQPELATDEDPRASHLEPAKMLYRHLALLGVWPGVDPRAMAAETLGRYGVRPRPGAGPRGSR